MKKSTKIHFLMLVLAVLLLCENHSTSAQTALKPEEDSVGASVKLTIESDRMEADLKENRVVFLEKVVAVDEDYNLNADKLTIFLSGENRNPEKILAEGRVKIVQENLISDSEKATILPNEDKVILEGNVRVSQGGNVFSGKTVEYTRSTGRVVMREGVRVSITNARALKRQQNPVLERDGQHQSEKSQ